MYTNARTAALVRRPLRRIPPRLRLPLAVYVACQAVLLLWWAAFYPGRSSPDSVTYTWEVMSGNWRGDHSVAYDAIVWLSYQITGGVAALTLLQTVAMAAALGYVCAMLRTLGVRGRWSAPAALVAVLLPSTGSFTVYVWKDVPFVTSSLVVFGALASLTARRLRRPAPDRKAATGQDPAPARAEPRVRDRLLTRDTWLLAAGCLGIGIFRNNDFPAIVCLGVVLVIAFTGMRRRVAVATAVPLVVALLLSNVVYPSLGVERPRPDQVFALNYADIGVAYGKRPDTFTAADLAVMQKVAPLSHWGGPGADCNTADPMMRPPMNRVLAGEINNQLMDLWFRVLKRTPGLIVDARICRASIAWAPWGAPTNLYPDSNARYLNGWHRGDYPSIRTLPHGTSLYPHPLSYKLNHLAVHSLHLSKKRGVQVVMWRGVDWTYVGYLAVLLVVIRRRRPVLLALAGLPLGLQLTVLVANPAQQWRYMSASIFLGALTLPLVALAFRIPPDPAAPPASQPPPQEAKSGEERASAEGTVVAAGQAGNLVPSPST